MNRRKFLNLLSQSTVTLIALPVIAHNVQESAQTDQECDLTAAGFKSFAFYQALTPTQRRSANRNDGTDYNMPCISRDIVDAGEDHTYEFWHGHGGAQHRFTVTTQDLMRLKNGEPIEIFTSVVDGHRHALRIHPGQPCQTPTLQSFQEFDHG